MINGDISDQYLRDRVLVNCDIVFPVAHPETVTRRLLRKSVRRAVRVPQEALLSSIWRFSHLHAVVFDLLVFGSETLSEKLYEDLTRSGLNPFRTVESYEEPTDLVSVLAFRPDIRWVVDVPERSLMYGSRSMSLKELV